MSYFLSIHTVSDELEKVTFLSLVVGVSHFSILGKNFPQSHLIIIRECPQNNITHTITFSPQQLFPNTPIIKDERVLSFFIT